MPDNYSKNTNTHNILYLLLHSRSFYLIKCSMENYLLTRLITKLLILPYLLNTWSRVLFEKPTSTQLVKKFPVFYGIWRFVTAFTRGRHLSPYLARSIQSRIPPSHFLMMHLNIIFPSMPGSSKWPPSLRFPYQTLYGPLLSLVCATCPAHLILLDLITQIIFGEQYRS